MVKREEPRQKTYLHTHVEMGKIEREREREREKAQARGIEHYGVKYMWANFEGTSCGR